jgi:hypothetical protein
MRTVISSRRTPLVEWRVATHIHSPVERSSLRTADLHHLVGATKELVHAPEVGAEGAGAFMLDAAQIAQIVANEGHQRAMEAGDADVARLSGFDELVGVDVQKLHDRRILHDVEAVLVLALEGQ